MEANTHRNRLGIASARLGGPKAWKRAGCWLVLGSLFIAIAAIINPTPSPASERLTFTPPLPELMAHDSAAADPFGTGHISADGLDSLGSLEGLDTTVWFYAGIKGPLASLHANNRDPIELVALEDLYRLAPELRLDTGITLMGEVPVEIDHAFPDW